MRYVYVLREKDGNGTEHTITGQVETTGPQEALTVAMRESYLKLTNGDTEYGKPGEKQCRGPYRILGVTLTLLPEE